MHVPSGNPNEWAKPHLITHDPVTAAPPRLSLALPVFVPLSLYPASCHSNDAQGCFPAQITLLTH